MATWEYEVAAGAPGWPELSEWLLVDRGLQWTAFDLWLLARDESCDASAYTAQLESAAGLTMNSDTFAGLTPKVLQLIDGVIVGWDSRAPHRGSIDVRSVATVAIEAIDGAWWRVYARDDRRLTALLERFPGALKLDPHTPMPAVHGDS